MLCNIMEYSLRSLKLDVVIVLGPVIAKAVMSNRMLQMFSLARQIFALQGPADAPVTSK